MSLSLDQLVHLGYSLMLVALPGRCASCCPALPRGSGADVLADGKLDALHRGNAGPWTKIQSVIGHDLVE